MSLCDTCDWCVVRKFYSPYREDYTTLVEGDVDEPMIISHCLMLDITVAGEQTIDCNHYKLEKRGDLVDIQLSMWEHNLFDMYRRKR